jgi:hypothetical protein
MMQILPERAGFVYTALLSRNEMDAKLKICDWRDNKRKPQIFLKSHE